MTPLSCQEARAAIDARRFIGWSGLPAGCSAADMFGIPSDRYRPRDLGRSFRRVNGQGIKLPGYLIPTVSIDDNGIVVMFDGNSPELDGGWSALQQDLGSPEAMLDYTNGMSLAPQSEWVYARRGITVFLNKGHDRVTHVAVYPPTTVEGWNTQLEMASDLKITMPPRRR
jgi:hypothetical protein